MRPIKVYPIYDKTIWGGNRLSKIRGRTAEGEGTVWEISIHPYAQSVISEGEYAGKTLAELVKTAHDALLGREIQDEDLLRAAFLDAKDSLSVQVHPDDEYAREYEGQWGKTEMWYVLGAKKESELIYGFNQDVTADQVRSAVGNGSIGALLNHVPVHKDDVFFIESGTVHAIGAGCLVAEIQQSSNLTYRLYDYDRTDRWGQKRELHLEKALSVAKLSSSTTPRQPLRVLKYKSGYASELLTRCRYFQVERMLLNTENRKLADFQTGKNSFHALLCVDGCGVLYGEDVMLPFFKGDCIFIPAESIPLKLHGRSQILNVSC